MNPLANTWLKLLLLKLISGLVSSSRKRGIKQTYRLGGLWNLPSFNNCICFLKVAKCEGVALPCGCFVFHLCTDVLSYKIIFFSVRQRKSFEGYQLLLGARLTLAGDENRCSQGCYCLTSGMVGHLLTASVFTGRWERNVKTAGPTFTGSRPIMTPLMRVLAGPRCSGHKPSAPGRWSRHPLPHSVLSDPRSFSPLILQGMGERGSRKKGRKILPG